MPSLRTILMGILTLLVLSVLFANLFPPSPPQLAQTAAEYGMTSEPAVVDCARAYGVPQNATWSPARENLVACVEALRKLAH